MSKWLTPKKTMDLIPAILIGAPGSLGSVPSNNYMDRGTQNHIVRLALSGPIGKNIVPPGVSGFIDKNGVPSVHFSDQLDLFANWQYKDLLFKHEDVLIHAESTQVLSYQPIQ